MATRSSTEVVPGNLDADVAEFLRTERRRQAMASAIGGTVLLLAGIIATVIAGYITAPEPGRRGEVLAAGLALAILGVVMIWQSIQNDQPSIA